MVNLLKSHDKLYGNTHRITNTKGTLIDNIFFKLSSDTVQCTSGILTDRFSDHQPYFASNNLHPLHKTK